ncbi:MAG: phosphatase PAP2 family protein [Anaerolineales bacterium]|nr:phosphatase PAP2 family protein [Anaerolineales bacterium]
MSYIVYLMRRGQLSDFHMRNRRERIKPMRAIPLFFLLSWLVFQMWGAPFLFKVMALVGALQATAMLLITLRWKISGHSAGAAAFSVFLWGLYGVVAAPVWLILPAVIWARVTLKRHDLAQSLAGALLGGASVLAVFMWATGQCLGTGLLFCSIP